MTSKLYTAFALLNDVGSFAKGQYLPRGEKNWLVLVLAFFICQDLQVCMGEV